MLADRQRLHDRVAPRVGAWPHGLTGRQPAHLGAGAREPAVAHRTLEDAGFRNYEFEWWRYTLRDEPFPETFLDFPVSRRALR